MRVAVLSGIIAGCLAEVAFLALHAVVIAPIWWSAGKGIPFAVICGALIGGGLHLVFPPRAYLTIGAFLWGSVALATLVVQIGRALPVRPAEMLEVALALLVAAGYGAAFGRTRKAAIGGAVASMAMLVVASGPFLKTTVPAMQLFVGLLPVTCLYAAAFVWFGRILSKCAPFRFLQRSPSLFPPSATPSSSETSTSSP